VLAVYLLFSVACFLTVHEHFFIVLSISLIFIILGVFNKITNYIILWFFRQDEHAADGYACKIGFGPELLHGLELLEKSSASEEKKGVLANINNDHPSLPHRIETIQKYLEKHPGKTHAYLP
jgi:STE24 endopeptidase